jgi:ABC-type lipoprotein export system ATPase subunit
VGELFERFGLAGQLLEKDTSSLSGGEKQRVALISALLLDRDIFLLDEVTSALDERSRRRVVDCVRSHEDVTVLFVAHESDLFAFVDQVVHLQDDRPSEGAP